MDKERSQYRRELDEIKPVLVRNCTDARELLYFSRQLKYQAIRIMTDYILEYYTIIPYYVWNSSTLYTEVTGDKRIHYGKPENYPSKGLKTKGIGKFLSDIYENSIPITRLQFDMDTIDGDFYIKINDGSWEMLDEPEISEVYSRVSTYITKNENMNKRDMGI